MNKKILKFFFILIALILGAVYYTDSVQKPIISTLNYFKTNYHVTIDFIYDGFSKYFFQANQITQLKTKIQMYESNHLIMQQLAAQLSDIYKLNNSSLEINPQVTLVKSISYQKFGDFNRVWLDVKDYNQSKIYGLTYNEFVAGIVIPKNGKALGLLNRDSKSSYTVFVGSNHAPGIAQGNNGKNILVKFIPAWFTINVGDEITTSGLDNIFFKGLKVGKVLSVTKSQGYQNAIVSQYYKSDDPNYFYIIKSTK